MGLYRNKRRGFTLTELAIVLGIIGIVLGSIWVAASTVLFNQKVNKTISDLLLISSNVRAMYSVHPFTSAAQADITCPMVTAGIFPPSMVKYKCVPANQATYPVSPWGSPVVLYGSTSAADASTSQFETWFPTIGSGAYKLCVAILIQLDGMAQTAGITNLSDASDWRPVPITPPVFNCGPNGGFPNQFSVDWKLRN